MKNPNSQEWSPNYPVPPSELPAYREKIAKMMAELAVEISNVDKLPFDEKEIWATVGKLRFGHPVTPLIIRYKALMWYHQKPPDPRGEPMASRPGPYTVYVRREDLVEVLGYSERTIDRMLAYVRQEAYMNRYEKITVERFCFLNDLPEDMIQQKLHDLFLKRWKKHKPKG